MPFIGVRKGEKVVPEEVGDDEIVECLECGEPMKPRSSHHRKIKGNKVFIARHFWHFKTSGSECGGGESYEHQRMKSIALSKLKETFDYSDSGLEKKIRERRPDVYAKFSEPRNPYGKGIVVEAQYRHESKDEESTTEDYFDCGYSVCWLEENDFSNKDVNLKENIEPVWPLAMPNHDKSQLDISDFGGCQKVKAEVPEDLIKDNWYLLVPDSSQWEGYENVSEYGGEQFCEGKIVDWIGNLEGRKIRVGDEVGKLVRRKDSWEIILNDCKLVECISCGELKKVTLGVSSKEFVCSSCKEKEKEYSYSKDVDTKSWKDFYSNIKRAPRKTEEFKEDVRWREILA